MPTALSTTKRKFHKLLDSISNASSISLTPEHDAANASTSTLPVNAESPAKRLKVARPVSAFTPSATRPAASVVRHSMIVSKPTATSTPPTMDKDEQKPPNFAPWDRGQFLARLQTFRHVDRWMSKPERVNEVQWAKRGWSCVGRERVGCVGGCGKEVVVKLENDPAEPSQDPETDRTEEEEEDWREKAREQLVEKYAEMITTEHAGGCLWRRRGCDDTIFRLPLAHQATALTALRQRYASLTEIASELPSTISPPPTFTPPPDSPQLTSLLHPQDSSSSSNNQNQPPTNHPALLLSLFGWQAEEPTHLPGLATCPACFRRLGLWLFRPSTSPSQEPRPPTLSRLDVVSEHRYYCPWINAESQNGFSSSSTSSISSTSGISTSSLAGWEILARWVDNAVRPRVVEERRESIRPHSSSGDAAPPGTASGGEDKDDGASGVESLAATSTAVDGASSRDEKDKQRWARLKRIKQAFNVRRGKGKGKEKEKAAATAPVAKV